jgi:hypothetical protein
VAGKQRARRINKPPYLRTQDGEGDGGGGGKKKWLRKARKRTGDYDALMMRRARHLLATAPQ